MNMRRLQGVALIVSAVINLVGLIGAGTSPVRLLFLIGFLLFILGVLAIEPVQKAGTLDWAGIGLIVLAAIIALVAVISSISGAGILGDAIPLASAALGAVGRAIVGWLTTRQKVFPAWAGWALIAGGVLNLVGPVLGGASLASAIGILSTLLEAAALFGYGGRLMQERA